MTLPPSRNLTGLSWIVDVHVLDHPDAADLRRMGVLGWVHLQTADTTMTEVGAAKDPATVERVRGALEQFPVLMGPMVLGHSVLGYSVLGSQGDSDRIRLAYSTLWPNNSYADDGSMTTAMGRTRFRDALHVATGVRYALQGFVTNDGPVLNRAHDVAVTFDGFALLSVEQATIRARTEIGHVRRRSATIGRPDPTDLPVGPKASSPCAELALPSYEAGRPDR